MRKTIFTMFVASVMTVMFSCGGTTTCGNGCDSCDSTCVCDSACDSVDTVACDTLPAPVDTVTL